MRLRRSSAEDHVAPVMANEPAEDNWGGAGATRSWEEQDQLDLEQARRREPTRRKTFTASVLRRLSLES